MEPQILHCDFVSFEVDGEYQCLPLEDVGTKFPTIEDIFDTIGAQEGDEIEKIQVHSKVFGARLSAPGYLDCTEWTFFETLEEAKGYILQDLEPNCELDGCSEVASIIFDNAQVFCDKHYQENFETKVNNQKIHHIVGDIAEYQPNSWYTKAFVIFVQIGNASVTHILSYGEWVSEALDNYADDEKINHLTLIEQDDYGEYRVDTNSPECSFLGNASEPHDLTNVGIKEISLDDIQWGE